MNIKEYKIIIAGSRSFNDYELLKNKISYYTSNILDKNLITIISGTANGADRMGEWYSREILKKEPLLFPAKWNDIKGLPENLIGINSSGLKYNKRAGHDRNEEMAKNATHCIVFWDGKSKGTQNMIKLAKKYNLKLKIVNYGI